MQFRVTRAGRDIYVGEVEGLLEAARNSEILPNDLIFDPDSERWRFARSMQLLAGFPLKSRSGPPVTGGGGSKTLEQQFEVKRTVKRKESTARTLILLGALILTVVAVALIPTERTLRRGSLSSFVHSNPAQSPPPDVATVILEKHSGEDPLEQTGFTDTVNDGLEVEPIDGGTDSGMNDPAGQVNSNQPSTGKQGEETGADGAEHPNGSAGTDGAAPANSPNGEENSSANAQQAGVDNGSNAIPTASPTGTEASEGGDADQDRAQPQGKGDKDSDSQTAGSGSTEAADPNGYTAAMPNAPDELVYQATKAEQKALIEKMNTQEREDEAVRSSAYAVNVLMVPPKNSGPASRLEQILGARHRAGFARLTLESIDKEHPDIPGVEKLLKDLNEEFQRLCHSMHDEKFCEIKSLHPRWSAPIIRAVAGGRVMVGMNHGQVHAIRGGPERIRRENGGRRYCYDDFCTTSVLFLGDVAVEIAP